MFRSKFKICKSYAGSAVLWKCSECYGNSDQLIHILFILEITIQNNSQIILNLCLIIKSLPCTLREFFKQIMPWNCQWNGQLNTYVNAMARKYFQYVQYPPHSIQNVCTVEVVKWLVNRLFFDVYHFLPEVTLHWSESLFFSIHPSLITCDAGNVCACVFVTLSAI